MHEGAGTHFDPALLAMFLANYEIFDRIAQANPDKAEADSSGMWDLVSIDTNAVSAPLSLS